MLSFLTPRRARWLLAAYLLATCAVVFQPTPDAAVGSVDVGYWLVQRLRLDALVTPGMIEFAWNVVLFVPITGLASFAWRRVAWEQWVGAGLIASGTIEFVQFVLLPARSASLWDLTSNTLGGMLGAMAARWWLLRRPRAARRWGRGSALRGPAARFRGVAVSRSQGFPRRDT